MADETVTTGAGGQPTSDPTSSAPDVSDDTQSVDPAASREPGDPSAQATAPTDSELDNLISDEDFEKLQDDPGELRRRYNQAYTKRAQDTAPARRLWKAMQENPDWVLEQLAAARGHKLSKDGTPAAGGEQAPADPETVLLKSLSDSIGEDAAKQVLPALQQMVEAHTKPYKDEVERTRVAASQQAAKEVERAFTERYPEWKTHEQAMVRLAQHIEPKGLSPFQFMELLYSAVNSQGVVADQVQKVTQRQQRSARAIADAAVSGAPEPETSSEPPAGPMTLRQALAESAEEVKRGGKRK